ncbi:E3 ubiquitin-protein ligase TRIM39-like [Fundulus heteroclitus]|uniref:E3 ubiquitin-protein ligase TRIM39-like n=1 Tax=Fundulus heteroclitus TaxID=8078 RepID=UPI00165B8C7F|nr:E3 ubiquitin-protein ligase TRIM39-like [Fundulus heteroclitus]
MQALGTTSETKDWSKTKVYSDLYIQTMRRAMDHLMNSFQTELKTLTNIELTRIKQYKESVIFDDSTAGPGLKVIEYGTRLKFSKLARSPSYELERFDSPMVFGTNGFTSGRHYWDVQVGLRNNWHVGVALETVDRSEDVIVKKDNGFFSIGKSGFDYEVHCSPRRVLHLCTRPSKLGIYVDYEEGRVSFYDLNERLHIHSYVGECFTGKLFPYFYLYSRARKSEALVTDP